MVVASALVGVPLAAGPASAAGTDGLWWYDAMGIGDAVAAGATGAGVTIGVIDGQINPDVPVLAGADLRVHEPSFCLTEPAGNQFEPATSTELTDASVHATNVVSMIVGTGKGYPGQAQAVSGIAPKATVLFYSAASGDNLTNGVLRCNTSASSTISTQARAIEQAVDDGAEILSISQTGQFAGEEMKAVEWALHKGVIIVVGLPNLGKQSAMFAALNGVVTVGAIDPDLKAALGGGVDEYADVRAPGTQILAQGDRQSRTWQATQIVEGSSFATPLVSGMLAAVWSRYPKATRNQLLQSLVRNTGGQDHALDRDATFGYGLASEAHMLRVDPTQYEDVNPLLTTSGTPALVSTGGDFTAADVASATRPEWAPAAGPGTSSTTTPSQTSSAPRVAAPAPGRSSGVPVLWWALAAGLALLVVGVALALTLGRRGRTAAGTDSPPALR